MLQHLLGVIVAIGLLVAATGFTARRVASLPRTPAPVRRAASATASGIRHPVRAARKGAPMVAETAETIWAKARSDNWLERQRIKRERKASRPPRSQTAARYARQAGKSIRARTLITAGRNPYPGPEPVPQTPPVAVNSQAPQRHLSAVPTPTGNGNGRTPTVTTGNGTTSAGYGAGADMLTSVQHLIAHVTAGGIQAKQRGYSVMSESFDYMAEQFTALANRMSEPGQNYPASAWEPWLIVAAHLKAAAVSSGEGASVVQSIRSMTVGELAESSVKAPHHEELNKA